MDDLLCDIEQQEVEELGLNAMSAITGITNDRQADFFIRRYKQLKETAQTINDAADSRIKSYQEKVNNWRESELASINAQMEYVSATLEAFAKTRLVGSKKRSVKMIEGTLGFSKQQPKYEYDDKKLRDFLDTVKDGSKFLEPQEPKLKWGEFKKAGVLDDDGIFRFGEKAVPGVVVTMRPDKFAVK